MKLASLLLTLLAAACLALANRLPVAEAELAGLLHLRETTWGGGGRLWVAFGAAVLAGLSVLGRSKVLAGFFTALALGMAIDICFSGWQWRAETFAMLISMGMEKPEDLIHWRSGALAFGAAILFLLASSVLAIYPRRREA